MVNGINTTKAQQMSGVAFGQPTMVNNYYTIKPQEPDSYMGKTLMKAGVVVGIAASLLFHKNIAQYIQKHAPGIYKWCGENIGKHISKFMSNHSENIFVKDSVFAKSKLAEWGDSIIKFIKGKGK